MHHYVNYQSNVAKCITSSQVRDWAQEATMSHVGGPGQPYLATVKIVLIKCTFFSETIYSIGLTFLQVIYESFECDLTQGFFILVSKKFISLENKKTP